jgi:hypothetical protein
MMLYHDTISYGKEEKQVYVANLPRVPAGAPAVYGTIKLSSTLGNSGGSGPDIFKIYYDSSCGEFRQEAL